MPEEHIIQSKGCPSTLYAEPRFDEQKHRAAMHINRKPGEQVEVDRAGDPATIIDWDTSEFICR